MSRADKHFKIAEAFSELLDNKFQFLGLKFGIEPLIALIPGIGDIASLLLSLYFVWIGWKMNLPGKKIAQMVGNVILDFVLGTIPLLGDVSDFFYKANVKNMEILRAHRKKNDVLDAEVIE